LAAATADRCFVAPGDYAARQFPPRSRHDPGVTLATVADRIIYADKRQHDHWVEGLRKAGLPE